MGSRYERILANRLYKHQFAVMRAPSSGSATTHELPDLIALKAEGTPGTEYSGPARRWAIEAKTATDYHIYLDAEEIDALTKFASRGGLEATIACRWKRAEGWTHHNDNWPTKARYLIPPSECYRTNSGSYRVTRPDKRDNPTADWPWPIVTADEVIA